MRLKERTVRGRTDGAQKGDSSERWKRTLEERGGDESTVKRELVGGVEKDRYE